ncbi:DUF4199 domain-containing protein [Altererythrobacter lutimaris]|uniref:DUF4199 domain-containing protein n=1 Tax=Altererythrobacter lutimaris TaxID=2743979 RepID=A0A850HBQ4_9SPHN|nr:DUF4199 domain-containing protein [Altererythrobacter lutimaris]NVE94441.1 DUF4199 domain-containing protein [Altererythrobacter lutimaris]
MLRYSLIYGSIIGVVVIAFMLAMMMSGPDNLNTSEAAGYAVMLAVLSLVFIGIKRFRDIEHGGVITFNQAAGVGAGIAVVAAVFYVITWEAYLLTTDYAFIETYSASLRADIEAQNLAEAARAAQIAELEEGMEMYRNPVFRLPITFIEIFPVGLVVALISALILKNPKVLPAKAVA